MNIPGSLSDEKRWVAWRNEQRGGKATKVPYAPNGKRAKADDPSTWGTRAEAEACAAKFVTGSGGGIGIQLGNLGDVYLAGIDLDSCLDENSNLAPWAAPILDLLDTYAERSPSGTGVKVLFYIDSDQLRQFLDLIGVEPGKWGTKRSVGLNGADHGPAIEIYSDRRFFTVTWDRCPGKPTKVEVIPWETLKQLVALIPKKRGGRDSSRSSKAFRAALDLRRAGKIKTFQEMAEALRSHADPEIQEWVRTKGEAD